MTRASRFLTDSGDSCRLIGKVKLADLKVRDVQYVPGKLAERLPIGSVRLARMILIQAIRNAMVNGLVAGTRRTWLPCPPESRYGRLDYSTWNRLFTEKARRVFQIPRSP